MLAEGFLAERPDADARRRSARSSRPTCAAAPATRPSSTRSTDCAATRGRLSAARARVILQQPPSPVPAAPDAVFALINDVERVASLPARRHPRRPRRRRLPGPGQGQGRSRSRAAYAGTVRFLEVDARAAAVCAVQAQRRRHPRQRRRRGRGRPVGVPTRRTARTLRLHTDLVIRGKIAQFGKGAIATVSDRHPRAVRAEPRASLLARLEPAPPPAPRPARAPRPPPRPTVRPAPDGLAMLAAPRPPNATPRSPPIAGLGLLPGLGSLGPPARPGPAIEELRPWPATDERRTPRRRHRRHLRARPASVPPVRRGQRPALVVVDLTRGFTEPAFPSGSDLTAEVVATTDLIEAARPAGVPVVFTAIAYTPAEADGDAIAWLRKAPGMRALLEGSDAVAIDPRLHAPRRRPPGGEEGRLRVLRHRRSRARWPASAATPSSCAAPPPAAACGPPPWTPSSPAFDVLVPWPTPAGDRAEGPHDAAPLRHPGQVRRRHRVRTTRLAYLARPLPRRQHAVTESRTQRS